MAASAYLDMFKRKVVWTVDLRNEAFLNEIKKQGLVWIRRLPVQHFHKMVRNPTVGCYVEVFFLQHPGTIAIDSPKAKKLINRVCYF